LRTTTTATRGGVTDVLSGTELLPGIAECAATLTGLLFVAITVAGSHGPADRPIVIKQVRAAASLLAFTNALAVSLFGLVPGNNVGWPAVVMAIIGIFFTAAGTRSIFAGPLAWRHVPRQLGLLVLLLLAFASELASGIDLIANPRSAGASGTLGNVLVALLLIGVARAWELVGDRETGIIASIAVLAGHEQNAAVTASERAPRPAESAEGDVPGPPGAP
jgi:hypothetical protein